jgi:hypothetical protein
MKTIDKNVRGLGSRPFAAFLLLGLLGFGFDQALNSNYAENRLSSVVESPFLATPAFAAEGAGGLENTQHSTQTTEAKARLLFKKNESSTFPHSWVEGMERFGRFTE